MSLPAPWLQTSRSLLPNLNTAYTPTNLGWWSLFSPQGLPSDRLWALPEHSTDQGTLQLVASVASLPVTRIVTSVMGSYESLGGGRFQSSRGEDGVWKVSPPMGRAQVDNAPSLSASWPQGPFPWTSNPVGNQRQPLPGHVAKLCCEPHVEQLRTSLMAAGQQGILGDSRPARLKEL